LYAIIENVENVGGEIMTDLEAILEAIDSLQGNDLDKLRQRINQRTHSSAPYIQSHDVEEWITNLHTVIDEFREGLSETELQDIVNSMNIGYISPKELNILQELADWAEDEP
jgi:flagellar biosynthesis chaperone FliJ